MDSNSFFKFIFLIFILKLEIQGLLNSIMRYLEIPMVPTLVGSTVERGKGTGLLTSYPNLHF